MRACESEDLPAVPDAPRPAGSSPRGMGVWSWSLRFVCLDEDQVRAATRSAARPPAVNHPSSVRTKSDLSTLHRYSYRLPAHRPET